MTANPYSCPKCEADSTQSITMLFQTGVQHGVSQTSMGGIGISSGGRIGVGVGSASTSTSTSMALVRKYAMGGRPMVSSARIAFGWILTVFGAIMILPMVALSGTEAAKGDAMGCLFGLVVCLLIPGLVLIFTHPGHKRTIQAQQARWDARRDYLSKCWVCFRCGHEWSPEA